MAKLNHSAAKRLLTRWPLVVGDEKGVRDNVGDERPEERSSTERKSISARVCACFCEEVCLCNAAMRLP